MRRNKGYTGSGYVMSSGIDHFVGAREEGLGNRKIDCFRGFHVDDQLELGRLLNRQFSGCWVVPCRSVSDSADLSEVLQS
jgi:hypothetical protein